MEAAKKNTFNIISYIFYSLHRSDLYMEKYMEMLLKRCFALLRYFHPQTLTEYLNSTSL